MIRPVAVSLGLALWSGPLVMGTGCAVDGEDAELEEAEAAAEAGCERQNEVVIWSVRHLNQLVDAFATHHSPCTTFFVSLPPIMDAAGRKTVPRAGVILQRVKDLRASGVRIRAMAEFHWSSWRAYVEATGGTWYDAGLEFRRRMDEAGYDTDAGDTWAINEFPSTVRTNQLGARGNARSAVRGLYDGGSSRRRGAVFMIGVGIDAENFSVYRPNVQAWVCDEPFWDSMESYVRFFGQEVYADPHRVCVGGATVASRAQHVNDFAVHLARMAGEGPACASKAQAYFDHAYTPTLSAAWQQSIGYGDTRITLTNMTRFLRLQVYALRAWSATHQVPDGRIGFAWASASTADAAGVASLGQELAASIERAYGPGGTALGACGTTGSGDGCDCAVSGASFNEAWPGFPSW